MTFFAVDTEAGFQAVARHQLVGSWQAPAELVRYAVAGGAERISLRWKGRRFELIADGAWVPPSILEAAARAMGASEGVERLQALAEMEDREATALIWAAGLDPSRLAIEVRGPDGGGRLTMGKGRRPDLASLSAGAATSLFISLTGPKIDRGKARAWLGTATRFSSVPVTLDGTDLRSPLVSGSFRARIGRPLPAEIAIGVAEETPRLWLLRDGVVETRVTVPRWPPFEAAIELSGVVSGWASPADLRRALSSFLPDFVDRVVGLMLRVVPRLQEIGDTRRSHLQHALLRASEADIRRREIDVAPMFELIDGGSGRFVSLEDLRRWSGRLPGVVDSSHEAFGHSEPLLRLEAREREKLSGLLSCPLEAMVASGAGGRWSLGGTVSTIVDLVLRAVRHGVLPDQGLTTQERALATALEGCFEQAGEASEVRFTKGRGSVHLVGSSLRLPRQSALVRHCVKLYHRRPNGLYVIALALAPRCLRISPAVRHAWQGES